MRIDDTFLRVPCAIVERLALSLVLDSAFPDEHVPFHPNQAHRLEFARGQSFLVPRALPIGTEVTARPTKTQNPKTVHSLSP